jgi:hypothetical protein
MADKKILLGLFAVISVNLFSIELFDLNGTWAGDIRHLNSPL